jgi:hypothetical protein
MVATHEDNTTHEWTTYASLADIGRPKHRKKQSPKITTCPKCNTSGRVNDFHNYKNGFRQVNYVVVHEEIDGTWGKQKRVARRRRCYIIDPEQRKTLLRNIGRLIEEPTKQHPKMVIVCPRCDLPGKPKQDNKRSRYFVDHYNINTEGTWGKKHIQKKYRQCCMRRKTGEVELYLILVNKQ